MDSTNITKLEDYRYVTHIWLFLENLLVLFLSSGAVEIICDYHLLLCLFFISSTFSPTLPISLFGITIFYCVCSLYLPPSAPHFPYLYLGLPSSTVSVLYIFHLQPHTSHTFIWDYHLLLCLFFISSTFSPTLPIPLFGITIFYCVCSLYLPPSAPHFPYLYLGLPSSTVPVLYIFHPQPHTSHIFIWDYHLLLCLFFISSTFSPTLPISLFGITIFYCVCSLYLPPSAPHFPYLYLGLPSSTVSVLYIFHPQPHTSHIFIWDYHLLLCLFFISSTLSPTLPISLFGITIFYCACSLYLPPSAPHFPYLYLGLPSSTVPVLYIFHLQPHTSHIFIWDYHLLLCPFFTSSTFSPTLPISLFGITIFYCVCSYIFHLQPHTSHIFIWDYHLLLCLFFISSTFSPTLPISLFGITIFYCVRSLHLPPSAPHFPYLYLGLPSSTVSVLYIFHLQPHTSHIFSWDYHLLLCLFFISSTFSPTLPISLFGITIFYCACSLYLPPSAPHFPYLYLGLPSSTVPVLYIFHLQPHTSHIFIWDYHLLLCLFFISSTFSPTLPISFFGITIFYCVCSLYLPPSAPHFPYLYLGLPSSTVSVLYIFHLQPHTSHIFIWDYHLLLCLFFISSTFSPTLPISLFGITIFYCACSLYLPPSAPHFPCLYLGLPSSTVSVLYIFHLQPHTSHIFIWDYHLLLCPFFTSSTFSPTLPISLFGITIFYCVCSLHLPPSAPHFPYLYLGLPSSTVSVLYIFHLQPHTSHIFIWDYHLLLCPFFTSSTFSPTLPISLFGITIFYCVCSLHLPPSAPHFPYLYLGLPSSTVSVLYIFHLQPHTSHIFIWDYHLLLCLFFTSSTFSPTLPISLFGITIFYCVCSLYLPPSAPHFPYLYLGLPSSTVSVLYIFHLQPHTSHIFIWDYHLLLCLFFISSTFSPTLPISLLHSSILISVSCPVLRASDILLSIYPSSLLFNSESRHALTTSDCPLGSSTRATWLR